MDTKVLQSKGLASSAQRYVYLDIIAGMLIIRMIMGHYVTMCQLKESWLYWFLNVFYFYMPWFFFKSGMFCSSEAKQVKPYFRSNIRKFIVPYVVFTLLGMLTAAVSIIWKDSIFNTLIEVLKNEISSIYHRGASIWNGPLWFILNLFLVRICFNIIRKYINIYILLPVFLFFAVIHNIYIADSGFYWGGCFSTGMVFYILGFIFKRLQFNKYIIIVSVILAISIFIKFPVFVAMYSNQVINVNGVYLIWFPFCLAGIIVVNNISKYISFPLVHYHLDDIGRNSITYYVAHYPLGLLFCSMYNHVAYSKNSFELLVYLIITSIGILPLVCYFFNKHPLKYLIGR